MTPLLNSSLCESGLDIGPTGKVAIVGGGSLEIGKACVKELLQEGATVVLTSHNPEINDTAASELLDAYPAACLRFRTRRPRAKDVVDFRSRLCRRVLRILHSATEEIVHRPARSSMSSSGPTLT